MTPQHNYRPVVATAFLGRAGESDIWEVGVVGVIRVSRAKSESLSVATIERLRGCVGWADEIIALLWRRSTSMPPIESPIEVVVESTVYVTRVEPVGEQDVYGFHGREYLGKTKPTGYRIGLSSGNSFVVFREVPGLSRAGAQGRRFELVLREVRS